MLNAIQRKRAQLEDGPWIPCTGEEITKTRCGTRVLYCWQPTTGRKAYFNCDTDMQIFPEYLASYGLGV